MGMMGTLPPELRQQLMQALASQKGGASAQPPAMQPQSGQQPPQMPAGDAPMPQFQTGRSTMMLPGGTASPAVPGVPQSATPPKQPGNTRASGLAAIPGAVMMVKQKMQQDKVQKARQFASQYIALKQSDDPNVQKTADAMMADPKVHKIFDKAVSDPNSPEYQGVQMAYRDQMSQEQQKVAMQEMKSKMEQQKAATQHQQALARQADATANQRNAAADTMGQVTEADRFKAEQKMQQLTATIQSRLQQTKDITSRMLETTKLRIEGTHIDTRVRANATITAAGKRAAATNNYIIQEYKALDAQLNDLDRTSTALSAQLAKETHWYGDDEGKSDIQQKITQIEAQRGVLTQQFQLLQSKDQAFQRSGLIEKPRSQQTQQPMVIPPGATVHDFSK